MSENETVSKAGGPTWRSRLEGLAWVAAAVAVIGYGSGSKNLLHVIATDERINTLFIAFGFVNCFLNALLFLYVYGWLGYVCGAKDPARSETLAVPAGAVTIASTIVGFIVGLWPVFGALAIVQVLVIALGLMSALGFIPSWGVLRAAADGAGGAGGGAGEGEGEEVQRPRRRRMRRHED